MVAKPELAQSCFNNVTAFQVVAKKNVPRVQRLKSQNKS